MLVLQGAKEQVEVLQFSPDGRTLVAPHAGGVQVWSDLANGAPPTAVLANAYVGWVRFTPDSQKVLLDGAPVAVYDLRTGEAAEVPLRLGSWGACDLTPDGRVLYAKRGATACPSK